MKTIIPVASGKGGVGKSVLVSNLGISLAEKGKTVVLIDLDLGGANLHTCLGIKNTHYGLGNYIFKEAQSLEELLVETNTPRLHFIPGDGLLPGTANLDYFTKRKLIKAINNITADYVLIDLGSGTTYNTMDFFLMSSAGLLVITPEPTSILNAYSFLKTLFFRALFRGFKKGSEERSIIKSHLTKRIEGSGESLSDIITLLTEYSTDSGERAKEIVDKLRPRIVLNNGKGHQDLAIGSKLKDIATKNLQAPVPYIGYLPHDDNIPFSVIKRTPYVTLAPDSQFSRNMHYLAEKLIQEPEPAKLALTEDDELLEEMAHMS